MSLSNSISNLIGFVQACGETISRDDMDTFYEMDMCVYVEAYRTGLKDELPVVPPLPKGRTMWDPRFPTDWEGKTNLPGFWNRDRSVFQPKPRQWIADLLIIKALAGDKEEDDFGIPPLDKNSNKWVKQKDAADLDDVKPNSLKAMRNHAKAKKNVDGTAGIDPVGRKWRKEADHSHTVWYFVLSLKKNSVSTDNSDR